ncbi:stage II sporulation protein R [Clostridium polyendosporum]|uniref:Stage II sporulation protein R n=1 Tax=Clostridium polyendosporum TaxID=69208 RepID=A0A919S1Q5_9CLOT|nr:stage II sporulation protein R [Clostridium polyendosporum]GIM29653.1 stage II sporulation protein R [Clostridium polyendosporum]
MKRISLTVIIFLVAISLIGSTDWKLNDVNVNVIEQANDVVDEINTKLIRFHVIANSDSNEDQNLKLKVRDKVLEYISPKLKDSQNIEQSRKIIKENDDKIRIIAEDIIKKNGYNYEVKTTLGFENFPVKMYGNITLPQGNYEAYRIIIGGGKGQNWWCVMFPPLCFVDIAKGQIAYKETEKEMKKVLSDKEFEEIDNINNSEQTQNIKEAVKQNGAEIKLKFKTKELIERFFQ